jgi:2-polyprenyl-3-methyl-5-hydroxy-6-metoxy-1,4-benzoquinol methylase
VSERKASGSTAQRQLLGATAQRILDEDPVYLSIYAARYKFVARILNSVQCVTEVGSGDGFGSLFLSKVAKAVNCIDIDEEILENCRERLSGLKNVSFHYHDLVQSPLLRLVGSSDAIVMVDVLEHIFAEEEASFLKNACQLLKRDGFAIVGTPNLEAARFAGEHSRRTHVNLKSAISLRQSLEMHFERVVLFGQNDEVIHTGFDGLRHYLWAIAFGPRQP